MSAMESVVISSSAKEEMNAQGRLGKGAAHPREMLPLRICAAKDLQRHRRTDQLAKSRREP